MSFTLIAELLVCACIILIVETTSTTLIVILAIVAAVLFVLEGRVGEPWGGRRVQ